MKKVYLHYFVLAVIAICSTSSLRAAKPKIDTTFTLEDGTFAMEITGIKSPIILAKNMPNDLSLDEATEGYRKGTVTSIDTAFTLSELNFQTKFNAIWHGHSEKITRQTYRFDASNKLFFLVGNPILSETPAGYYWVGPHMSCACSGPPHPVGASPVPSGFMNYMTWLFTVDLVESPKALTFWLFMHIGFFLGGILLVRMKFFIKSSSKVKGRPIWSFLMINIIIPVVGGMALFMDLLFLVTTIANPQPMKIMDAIIGTSLIALGAVCTLIWRAVRKDKKQVSIA